jgi:hypothetical protein
MLFIKMERKIKINGKVKEFDMSDGKGNIPFSMNGIGQMRIVIGGVEVTDKGYIENKNMLDGNIEFENVSEKIFEMTYISKDERINKSEGLMQEDNFKDMSFNDKMELIRFNFKYYNMTNLYNGYNYDKEIVLENISVAYSKDVLVVFSSHHKSYFAPDFLKLNKKENKKEFNEIILLIKNKVLEFAKLK